MSKLLLNRVLEVNTLLLTVAEDVLVNPVPNIKTKTG